MNSLGVANSLVCVGARKAIRVLGVTIAVFLGCLSLFSQVNTGRILGTVTDQTGGTVAGATVTVTDTQRGVSRPLITDQAGEYSAPNLLPSTYTVRAEFKGFKSVERPNILVEVGRDVRIDLTMQPGEVTQMVIVTEAAPMVETTNATLGGTLNNQTINDLPLNGRDYINLITLRPGLTVYTGGGTSTRSSNGLRAEDIGYLVDGLRADEAYTGQSILNAPIPAGDSSTSLPIDAIQEFNTEENPKAEFGWKPGAIVNAGLKSGTNALHGTAFAFGRDTALDARNFFDTAPTPKAAVALEQFGASAGGAIKKDKLFWFVNYEGQRYSVQSTYQTPGPATIALPASADPLSKLSLVDACKAVGFANVSPLSALIAGLNPDCSVRPANFTPGPSESLFPTNTTGGNVVIGLISHNQMDNGVGKIDYHINDHHTLSGLYFNGRGGGIWNDAGSEPGVAGSSNSPFMSALGPVSIQLAAAGWTWTPSSTWVNELRAGYNRFYQPYLSVDHSVNPTAYGINTGVTDPRFFGFPLIQISPYSYAQFHLGGNWPKIEGPDANWQFLDHVSYLRGKHAFKFGGEFIYNSAMPFVTQNGKGRIKFSSLQNFLKGNVAGTGSRILVGDPLRHLHNEQFAAFAQDDWHIKPRVTVNLGLRYELTSVMKDSNSQLGNFDPSLGLVQVGKQISSPFNVDPLDFSPRVGVAWDVRGDGKTVVRAGGSLMYEQLPLNVFIAVSNQLGINQVPTGASIVTTVGGVTTTTPGSGNMGVLVENLAGSQVNWKGSSVGGASVFNTSLVCGDGLPSQVAGVNDPPACNTEAVARNLRNPYVGTWTVSLQRAITNNLSLEVAYVGTHGDRLLGFQNINDPALGSGFTALQISQGDPSAAVASKEQAARPFTLNCAPPIGTGSGKSCFPYLANINFLSNIDRSNYNALQTTLTERLSHGLSFTVGYTYAHGLDNASSNFNANPVPLNSANPGLQYASSDFDIRHRLTISLSYAIPGIKVPGQLLEGWQINSIIALQSGSPWGAQDLSNDFSGTGQVVNLDSYGQAWDFFGNPSDFKSGPTAIPLIPGGGPLNLPPNPPTSNAACNAAAAKLGPAASASLNINGCYAKGSSVLIPPALGTYGSVGRNLFRDSGYRNWDFSVTKNWRFAERLNTQFRAEFFNILNHPEFTNPNGPGGAGFNDPSAANFGCGCLTPDQTAPNPVLGNGANRSIQLGLKLIW